MSKFSDMKSHVRSLEEIRAIIDAMKNLSIVELNKIAKYLLTQKEVVQTIESAARDFYSFHAPKVLGVASEMMILIGSERGFCGPFNEMLLNRIETDYESIPIIAVGKKLHSRLDERHNVLETLDGPNTIEEIENILAGVIRTIGNYSGVRWLLAYNEEVENRIEPRFVRPFDFLQIKEKVKWQSEPVLYLQPDDFSIQLMDQYIMARMYFAFYSSFAAENRERLRHMDGAVTRIDKKLEKHRLQLNRLRQEEITEEIEVILLNVGNHES